MNRISDYHLSSTEHPPLVKERKKDSLFTRITTIVKVIFYFIKDTLSRFTRKILSPFNVKIISKQPSRDAPGLMLPQRSSPLTNGIPKKESSPPLAISSQISTATAHQQKRIQEIPTLQQKDLLPQIEDASLNTEQKLAEAENEEQRLAETNASGLILLATNVLASVFNLGTDPVSKWISLCHSIFFEYTAASSLEGLDLSFKRKLFHYLAPPLISGMSQVLLPELSFGVFLCKTAYKAHRTFLMGKNTFSEIKKSSFSKESTGMHLLRTINTIFAIKGTLNLARAAQNALINNIYSYLNFV